MLKYERPRRLPKPFSISFNDSRLNTLNVPIFENYYFFWFDGVVGESWCRWLLTRSEPGGGKA